MLEYGLAPGGGIVRYRCCLALALALCAVRLAPAQDVVFIANGSGDFRTASRALEQAVAETGAPLQLETLVWSYGFGRYLRDHTDHHNHVAAGCCLAQLVAVSRQACPDRAVFLVSHSAGSAVVLTAAANLPPGSVERIVLLAPSVCADYDLRPALRGTRCGIDNFRSRRDLLELGVGVTLAGTADRRWSAAAGRVGFHPVVTCPGDAELYAKLREHPWDEDVAWTGNHGGHYGTQRGDFARVYLLPLLRRDGTCACPVVPPVP
jgi:pimeloyl-ACP methyl ester carboxylesterase